MDQLFFRLLQCGDKHIHIASVLSAGMVCRNETLIPQTEIIDSPAGISGALRGDRFVLLSLLETIPLRITPQTLKSISKNDHVRRVQFQLPQDHVPPYRVIFCFNVRNTACGPRRHFADIDPRNVAYDMDHIMVFRDPIHVVPTQSIPETIHHISDSLPYRISPGIRLVETGPGQRETATFGPSIHLEIIIRFLQDPGYFCTKLRENGLMSL